MVTSRFKLAEAFAELTIHDTKFKTTLNRVHAQLDKLQRGFQTVARHARRMLMVGGLAFAGMVTQAAAFEQSMARVAALTGATTAELQQLTSAAREMGRTTVFTARQSAAAMSAFALAGFDTNKILKSLKPTLDLAAAGQIDIGQAADIVAKIMAGMKLEASELGHTVDVLTKAFTSSQTNLLMLGDAMKFVGPVAKASGKEIEEVVGIIQVLSNVGIQGSLAGTSLRNMLARLAKEGPEVRKVFKSLGVEIKTAAGHLRPMADIVDDFNVALKRQNREAESMGLAMLAFGMRAGPGFAALLQEGGDEIRRFEKQLEDAGGTAERIARIQLNTFLGQLKLMWSAIQDASIEIGNIFIPMLRGASARITELAASIGGLNSQTADAIATWGMFTAAFLGFLVLVPSIIGAFKMIAVGVAALGVSTGTGPIALLIVALGALGAAFIAAKVKGEDLDVFLGKLWRSISGVTTEAVSLADALTHLEKIKALQESIKARTGRTPQVERTEEAIKAAWGAFVGAIPARFREDIADLWQMVDAIAGERQRIEAMPAMRPSYGGGFGQPGYGMGRPQEQAVLDKAIERFGRSFRLVMENAAKASGTSLSRYLDQGIRSGIRGLREGYRELGAAFIPPDLRPEKPWPAPSGVGEIQELASLTAAEAIAAIKKKGMADLMRLDERQRLGMGQVGGGTVGFAGLQGQMQRAISAGEAAQAKRDAARDKILTETKEAVEKIKVPEVVFGP